MSTSYAMAYQAKPDAVVRSCAICGHDFTEYDCPAHYGPVGNKACYWCLSRKHVYARFNKLIGALEEALEGNPEKGRQALEGIRKALA